MHRLFYRPKFVIHRNVMSSGMAFGRKHLRWLGDGGGRQEHTRDSDDRIIAFEITAIRRSVFCPLKSYLILRKPTIWTSYLNSPEKVVPISYKFH